MSMTTTLRDVTTFYWRCLKRAFSGKFAKAVGWTGGLSVIALVIAWITLPSASDERTLLTVLPAAFFVVAFSLIVLWGIIFAPVEIYRDERRAREAVEALRQPKAGNIAAGHRHGKCRYHRKHVRKPNWRAANGHPIIHDRGSVPLL
ncbi:hypothetical protein P7L64_22485 [Tistrella bauzanensis]|uniref:hypothetical protein n=1 Tax=Tistrella bauzanensis TaxID=657419 RepID=UPI00166E487D|nr:hypothetical protein [Tistrella bauzanensis]